MRTVKKGATDQTFYFKMVDSAAGTPETGLTITNFDITYVRNRAAHSKTDATALGSVNAAHADNQAIEVDATQAPGLYRVDFPDAAFASGADDVILIVTCTGCDPAMINVPLVDNIEKDTYDRIGAPTGASIAADIATIDDFLDTEVAAIKAKTDNLPSDPADASDIASSFSTVNSTLSTIAGYLDTEVAAIKAKTDNLPSDPADASDIASSFSTVNSTLSTIAGYLDTEVAAIKAKTDNLPSDPADASDIAGEFVTVNATLATLAGYVDTEVAAIKAKTDNLPTDPADASDIAASFASIASTLATIAAYIDTEVAAIKAKTDNLPAAPAAVGDIPTAAQNAAGLLDLAAGVETNRTVRQALRLILAASVGKLSGAATTTVTIRDTNDGVNRIVATVDADGNRSAVTLDAS